MSRRQSPLYYCNFIKHRLPYKLVHWLAKQTSANKEMNKQEWTNNNDENGHWVNCLINASSVRPKQWYKHHVCSKKVYSSHNEFNEQRLSKTYYALTVLFNNSPVPRRIGYDVSRTRHYFARWFAGCIIIHLDEYIFIKMYLTYTDIHRFADSDPPIYTETTKQYPNYTIILLYDKL